MGEIKYLMSQKQITRYTVISNFINGEITRSEAAERLSLSELQQIQIMRYFSYIINECIDPHFNVFDKKLIYNNIF